MASTISNACRREINLGGRTGSVYSLPALEQEIGAKLSRLPISIRIVLESLLRN
jgi:aconitate hydratase